MADDTGSPRTETLELIRDEAPFVADVVQSMTVSLDRAGDVDAVTLDLHSDDVPLGVEGIESERIRVDPAHDVPSSYPPPPTSNFGSLLTPASTSRPPSARDSMDLDYGYEEDNLESRHGSYDSDDCSPYHLVANKGLSTPFAQGKLTLI
jgi:hypothetical protein